MGLPTIAARVASRSAESESVYSFLRRPAWVILHLLVLLIATAFVMLGRWQLERLGERGDENAQIARRLSEAPTEWLAGSSDIPPEYVRLRITGEFRPDEEVLLRSQVNLGRPGFDVLTPLYLDESRAIVINRGWVPFDLDRPPVAEAAPPPGTVTITGLVRHPLVEARAAGGIQDGVVSSVDLVALDEHTAAMLASFYVELTEIRGGNQALPIVDDAIDLSDGPHLAYAVQWFAFAAVGVVGYAALIRSTARRRGGVTRREEPRRPDPS